MTTGMSRSLLFWLAVLLIVMGGTGLWLGRKYSDSGILVNIDPHAEVDEEYRRVPPDGNVPWLKEFTLVERSGATVKSADLKNQVYVTNFFYSTCPTTCRKQNEKIQEVELEYGPKGVKFLSISCDPETDTPSRLREYATTFKASATNWLFLTGDLTYIRRIAGEIYETALDKQTHTEHFYVTDKWGNARGRFLWKNLSEMTEMKLLLGKLLAETEPPASLKKKVEPMVEGGATDSPEVATPEEATEGKSPEAAEGSKEDVQPLTDKSPVADEAAPTDPEAAKPVVEPGDGK